MNLKDRINNAVLRTDPYRMPTKKVLEMSAGRGNEMLNLINMSGNKILKFGLWKKS